MVSIVIFYTILSNSSDIWFFSLQFIPHAFLAKLSWMKSIPFVIKKIKAVNLKIKAVKSSIYYILCCCHKKQSVKPQGEKEDKKESNLKRAVTSITINVIKRVATDKLLENKINSSIQEHYQSMESNKKKDRKGEGNLDELEEAEDIIYIMIIEAVNILGNELIFNVCCFLVIIYN